MPHDPAGSTPPLACQRERYALPADQHYLNGAYMSPLSHRVVAAGRAGMMLKTTPAAIRPADFFTRTSAARTRFARLVNAAASRIAIIPAASYGMATVAQNLPIASGQRILLLDEQFPSNVYSWQRLAADTGARIHTITAPDSLPRGQAWNEGILAAIDETVALIAMPHVHWVDGTVFDLAAIGKRARQVGAALVIDGTQSLGALPFDIAEIQPDALIVAAYKWLMCPYGVGFAYYGPRLDAGRPLEENWLARKGAEDFSRLVDYQSEYAPGAVRYDMGEAANPILLDMAIAALDEILEDGVAARQAYCRELVRPFLDELGGLGLTIEPEQSRAAHLFGLRLPPEADIQTVARTLESRDVVVSVRGTAVRVSPNVYNDAADMTALVEALATAID